MRIVIPSRKTADPKGGSWAVRNVASGAKATIDSTQYERWSANWTRKIDGSCQNRIDDSHRHCRGGVVPEETLGLFEAELFDHAAVFFGRLGDANQSLFENGLTKFMLSVCLVRF